MFPSGLTISHDIYFIIFVIIIIITTTTIITVKFLFRAVHSIFVIIHAT